MHKDRRTASWLSRWMRARTAPARDDAADYGTAFGLELSVGPVDPEHPPLAGIAAAPVPFKPVATHWWSRRRQRAA